MEIYKYMFYRLYLWQRKTWGKEDMPEQNALYFASSIMLINIGFILLLIDRFFVDIFGREYVIPIAVLLGVLLIIFNYFQFIHKKKLLEIEKRYANEPKNVKNKKFVLLFGFVILSFVLFFGTAVIISNLNSIK